jgi:SAM-dependent methyltransferase
MSEVLETLISEKKLPDNCKIQTGKIDQLTEKFDAILYIDVLEHIESDREEISKAAALLNNGGHLIVLSPAFQFLYNPFDKAIGHYRRYNKRMLRQLTPHTLKLLHCRYYDSAGYFAALVNKLLLRQKYPTVKQVLFWDRWIIPVSRITDKLLFNSFGKSIISVWKKEQLQ